MDINKNLTELEQNCKDCNKPFTLSEQEAEWYKQKGFELPKRCVTCRRLKKLKFANLENGRNNNTNN